MYNIISSLRFLVIIFFILYLFGLAVWFIIKIVLIPAIVFYMIMKLFSFIKINKIDKNEKKYNDKKKNIIDGEFEDLD